MPDERDGRAQILVVGANMTYLGVRFTEVSFSVEVVAPEYSAHPNAAFLMRAFNTSRMFAFCERAFFRTPYYHGDCRISTSSPVSIQLVDGAQPIFHAKMQSDSPTARRELLRSGVDVWEGPDFLAEETAIWCEQGSRCSSEKWRGMPRCIRSGRSWTQFRSCPRVMRKFFKT